MKMSIDFSISVVGSYGVVGRWTRVLFKLIVVDLCCWLLMVRSGDCGEYVR